MTTVAHILPKLASFLLIQLYFNFGLNDQILLQGCLRVFSSHGFV